MLGLFCALEGIDGSGKSTLHQGLRLQSWETVPVVFTHEPTDGPFGQQIRQALNEHHDQHFWLELFTKDREWNMREQIGPALKEGQLIIQDRCFFSTAAYQGDEDGISPRAIVEQSRKRFIEPELLFFLQIDPDQAMQRTGLRQGRDTFERNSQYLKKVNDRYKTILPQNTVWLDATRPAEELMIQTQSIILQRWQQKSRIGL
ncbi:MAG: dTMP kinase [Spirochaetales bacterium]|nr:dTMP kinase [Spirochaetales bacterium]